MSRSLPLKPRRGRYNTRTEDNAASDVQKIREQLKPLAGSRASSDPRKAVQPVVRKVLRRRGRKLELLLPVSRLLWKDDGVFARWVAVELLAAASRKLEADHWKELHGWIGEAGRTDLCDAVAAELLGALVRRDRAWCRVLRHWTQSDSVWERRASVAAVSPRVTLMADVEAGLSICEALMRDSDARIHEAVASLLREVLDADPDEGRDFLDRWAREGRREILDAVESK